MTPLIGITTSLNHGEQRLDSRYVQAVVRAGGEPFIVPMVDDDELLTSITARLDAVIMTGGPAVTEGLIGTLPDDISETDMVRVENDRRLLKYTFDHGLPFLGICYGMQMLNAYFGGTIFADVEAQKVSAKTHSEKRGGSVHDVDLIPDTHLRRLFGTPTIVVNTRHIQAVAETGRSLIVSARAADGVVEGIESADGRFVGVQFHPERMGPAATSIFEHVVDMAYETHADHANSDDG